MKRLTISVKNVSFQIQAMPAKRRANMPRGSVSVVADGEGHTLIQWQEDLYSPSLRGGNGHGIGNWLNLDRHWTVLLQMLGHIPKGSVKEYDEFQKKRDACNRQARHVQQIITSCQQLGVPVPAKVAKMSSVEKSPSTEWKP